MSEQKVWVEKLPESCSKCLFCYDNRPYWKSTDCIINHKELDEDEIETSVNKNCPLQSIHDHDREKDKRIKELEQKVQELQEVDNKRAFRLYCVLYDLLEEKYPENVASKIEYMTSENYADICEMYKTAKNLKQHDRELVKEVCEKIKELGLKHNIEDLNGVFISYKALQEIQKDFENGEI